MEEWLREVNGCGQVADLEMDDDSVLVNMLQMLNSVQGMVDRTRQSMAALKDRVQSTHLEMERKEVRGREGRKGEELVVDCTWWKWEWTRGNRGRGVD